MKRKTEEASSSTSAVNNDRTRTGTTVAAIKQAIIDNLHYVQGRTPELASRNDWYMAVAFTVRDRMLDNFIRSIKRLTDPKVKIASYLSAEFLMGPHLGNNLLCLGITDQVREAVQKLGQDLDASDRTGGGTRAR